MIKPKRHPLVETVVVICEGSSEYVYLQELNRFFRANHIPLAFSGQVIGYGSLQGGGEPVPRYPAADEKRRDRDLGGQGHLYKQPEKAVRQQAAGDTGLHVFKNEFRGFPCAAHGQEIHVQMAEGLRGTPSFYRADVFGCLPAPVQGIVLRALQKGQTAFQNQ